MKIVRKGIEYQLENYSKETYQTIIFTAKTEDGNYEDGTTNEELIQCMIDRFYTLQEKRPSNLNIAIITLLKSIRQLLKQRVSRKQENIKAYNDEFKDY